MNYSASHFKKISYNLSGVTGLVMKSFMPAARQASRPSLNALAVMAKIAQCRDNTPGVEHHAPLAEAEEVVFYHVATVTGNQVREGNFSYGNVIANTDGGRMSGAAAASLMLLR